MTPIRPECAPLPPGVVLPPMAAPEALQGPLQTQKAADAGGGNGRGKQRPNKPNQTRQSSKSCGKEPRHNPNRFETINTFVDVTAEWPAAFEWLGRLMAFVRNRPYDPQVLDGPQTVKETLARYRGMSCSAKYAEAVWAAGNYPTEIL